jgi:hypothetical protein
MVIKGSRKDQLIVVSQIITNHSLAIARARMSGTKSAIIGKGYGSNHNWKKLENKWNEDGSFGLKEHEKETNYECRDCGIPFKHRYGLILNVFAAIRHAGIPEECIKK